MSKVEQLAPAEQWLRTQAERMATTYPQYRGYYDGWRFGVTSRHIRLKGGDVEAGTPVLVGPATIDPGVGLSVTLAVTDADLIMRNVQVRATHVAVA